MSYQRLAYDDQDSAVQMHDDCTACASSLTVPAQRVSHSVETSTALDPAPSLTLDAFPRHADDSATRPVLEVSEAAAHLAARLHLHLD